MVDSIFFPVLCLLLGCLGGYMAFRTIAHFQARKSGSSPAVGPRRPIMPNVWFAIGAPLGAILALSLIEGATGLEIPGELWGIIGAVASKSMDLAQMIVTGESPDAETEK